MDSFSYSPLNAVALPTAEDSLNVSMKDITVTARDGQQSKLETIYIRGSMIRFIVVPDMLQQAPMFKRIGPNAMKGRGIGSARGRATIMRGAWRCKGEREGEARPGSVSLGPWLLADTASFLAFLAAQSRRGRGGPVGRGQGIRR